MRRKRRSAGGGTHKADCRGRLRPAARAARLTVTVALNGAVPMRRTRRALRTLLWVLVLCLLAAPRPAVADQRSVLADFDGDGQRDRATLDRVEPSILHVWLSTTRSTAIVRSQTPISRIAALDLDGDRRAELIAGGGSPGLQIWTKRRKGFSRVDPRPVAPGTIDRPLRHNVEDDGAEAPPAITSTAPSSVALLLTPQPRAPDPVLVRLLAPSAAEPYSSRHSAPRSPRAPPVLR